MAKAPRPGRSKTRLCPPLRPEDAASLSGAFLRDTTRTIARAGREAPISPYAAYAPAGDEDLVAAHMAPGTSLLLADGSSPAPADVVGFGRCLLQAIESMLARGHPAACVLSSDVPTLPARLLVEAARHLLAPGDRAVLGACPDGGYYILGLKAAHSRMFSDIAWSTERVAEQTRERAREIGLDLVELDPWYDVDDAVSLSLLLSESTDDRCPATRAVIDRLKLHETVALRQSA
ncbi:DUF2064 domain-containing protein [uncultured Enterovirga sp.]|uniref:TIGR04282 family arsenosugar biosynthesis glycosyltransferase n=1 Tax=uncultured Enterovirga sp. TaxID=2026352 RepID=UPI0035CC5B77